ncbi:MAG: hypothetical protein OEW87_13525 [Flavobacteriaceae bacterium]|nr:hypothetical protein [Flavobacteriaceae bacterium]
MDLVKNWPDIRKHFSKSFGSSLHCAIASVDQHNKPTLTPIGSLFLNKDQTGFYFEKFPKKLPKNIKTNTHISVLGVNSSKWFWLRSLFKGKFKSFPALKLYGTVGDRRKANPAELRALKRRMKFTSGLKGHKYLWNDMDNVRELTFTSVEKINIGKMTHHL